MKKIITIALGTAVITIGALMILKPISFDRVQYISSLFSGAEQYNEFGRIREIFPVSTLEAVEEPFQFGDGLKIDIPDTFLFDGKTVNTNQFLQETDTVALLILKDGDVRYENYSLTGGRYVNWISMSVAKSFISALIGIALEEGHINSINEPITQYCPSLKGSAYDGVAIKDILQMSSGAAWNEDYSDANSDIMRFGKIMALGGSLNEFSATLTQDKIPGTYNHYNSVDTQVLGMLLVSATGRSVTDYMQEKLWSPLGMESDAHWMLDDKNMEMVFGGLNATARDYAKLGELYRQGGNWNGHQIVPEAWVNASITPDAPHLLRGRDEEQKEMGYGYQWWLPAGRNDDFTAIGVYNQFIYVNKTTNVVIVKLSANSSYGIDLEESSYRERESTEFFRTISDQT